MLVESEGFSETEISRMIGENPAKLFNVSVQA
jgi:predicted metal-dependent phosphotriesterase family hydrolase